MKNPLRILHIANHEAVERKELPEELFLEGVTLDTIDSSPAFLEAAEYDNYDCIVYEGSEEADGLSLLNTIRDKSKETTLVFSTSGEVADKLKAAFQDDGHARIEVGKELPSLLKSIVAEPGLAKSDQRERDALLLTNKIANVLPQSVIAIDDDGRIVYVNDTSLKMLGYSAKQQLSGRPILKLFPLAKNNDGLADIRSLLSETDRKETYFRWKMVGSSNENIEVRAACVPFRFQNQRLTALVFHEESKPDLAAFSEPVTGEAYSQKRILVVSDGLVMKSGLQLLFKEEKDNYLFVEASSDIEERIKEEQFDSILFATSAIDTSKRETIERIRNAAKTVPFMIASLSADEEVVGEVIKNGAAGVVYNEKEFQDIPHALRMISDGAVWFSKGILSSLLGSGLGKKRIRRTAKTDAVNLTNREREVLNFLAQGYKNKSIAEELKLSYRTVVTHVYNIYRKLKISSRTEAIHYAISHRLIDVEFR